MAARSSEHPKLLLVRTLQGLAPATPYDAERLSAYALKATVEATLWQNRSLGHHRLYWAVLKMCVDNSEGKYGKVDDLHSAIKTALGYTHKIKLLVPSEHANAAMVLKQCAYRAREILTGMEAQGQETRAVFAFLSTIVEQAAKLETDLASIYMPGSIAFDRMDQAEFRTFFDQAMTQLRLAGYPVGEFLEEAQKQMARLRQVEPKPKPPYHGESDVPAKAEAAKPPPPQPVGVGEPEDGISFQERGESPGSLDGYSNWPASA
jgi:hypothetical protein